MSYEVEQGAPGDGATRGQVAAGGGRLGFAVGALIAAAENLWLAASRELYFESAIDRVLFAAAAVCVEAAVAAAAGAALAWLIATWQQRRVGSVHWRAAVWPAALLVLLARVGLWATALVASWSVRDHLVAGATFAAVGAAGACGVHALLRRRPDGGRRRVLGLAQPVTALLLGLALFASRAWMPAADPPPEEVAAGSPEVSLEHATGLRLPPGTPVILILLDTLRADHLSFAGYARQTSPNLDRLASRGVVFERAIAQATRTSPNMASLLTGTSPLTHRILMARSILDADLLTWAEILQPEGYATAGILANPNMGSNFGFTQGLDHVTEVFDWDADDASVVVARGLDRFRQSGARPSFLWLHFADPHSPYTAPAGSDRYRGDSMHREASSVPLPLTKSRHGGVYPAARLEGARSLADYVARYDAEIRFFDEQLAAFLDGLEALPSHREPLLAFTSDHGESLGDHDYYFSHGDHTYDDTAHVPLLFHHSALPAGLRVSSMVRTIDVLPTVLDLLGIPVPESIEGRSLVPLMEGVTMASVPSLILAGTERHIEIAVRDDRYKLVARPVDAGVMDEWARVKLGLWRNGNQQSAVRGPRYRLVLYDLREDPDETRDVSARVPEVAEGLLAYMRSELRSTIGEFRGRKVETASLSKRTQAQLRALGYIE